MPNDAPFHFFFTMVVLSEPETTDISTKSKKESGAAMVARALRSVLYKCGSKDSFYLTYCLLLL